MTDGVMDLGVNCPCCGRPARVRLNWPEPRDSGEPQLNWYLCPTGCRPAAERILPLMPAALRSWDGGLGPGAS